MASLAPAPVGSRSSASPVPRSGFPADGGTTTSRSHPARTSMPSGRIRRAPSGRRGATSRPTHARALRATGSSRTTGPRPPRVRFHPSPQARPKGESGRLTRRVRRLDRRERADDSPDESAGSTEGRERTTHATDIRSRSMARIVSVGSTAARSVRRFLGALALFIGIAVLGCQTTTRVDAGHVGIRVKLAGSDRGIQDMPVVTGWVFYNPLTEQIVLFPTSVQNVVWSVSAHEGKPFDESLTFSSSEGVNINSD